MILLIVSISGMVSGTVCLKVIDRLGDFLTRFGIDGHLGKIKKNLISAGIYEKFTAARFLALQLICGMILLSVMSILQAGAGIVPILCGFLGFFMPPLWLKEKTACRHQSMREELPYFTDLFMLSVEAGMDFNSSLNCIMKKMAKSPLREEFTTMQHEIRMGETRRQAMIDARERVNLPEFSSFISALIQADTFGTGLVKILRIQTEELRRRRSERAEKLAMQAPVKMLLPLIGFIFPAVFIILLGPIILQLISGKL